MASPATNKRPAKCIFCDIVDGKSPTTKMVYENDNILIFHDIKPASDFHYLAIPRVHIDNAKCLTVDHRELGDTYEVTITIGRKLIVNPSFCSYRNVGKTERSDREGEHRTVRRQLWLPLATVQFGESFAYALHSAGVENGLHESKCV
jgi:histidine triad (HIT) family protein